MIFFTLSYYFNVILFFLIWLQSTMLNNHLIIYLAPMSVLIRRYMAEILPIWRKTLSSQPINYSYLGTKATFGVLALPLLVTYVLKAYPMTSYWFSAQTSRKDFAVQGVMLKTKSKRGDLPSRPTPIPRSRMRAAQDVYPNRSVPEVISKLYYSFLRYKRTVRLGANRSKALGWRDYDIQFRLKISATPIFHLQFSTRSCTFVHA